MTHSKTIISICRNAATYEESRLSSEHWTGRTEKTVYVVESTSGVNWYCVHGGDLVNATGEALNHGCDVELVGDYDCFTADKVITSESQLMQEVEAVETARGI